MAPVKPQDCSETCCLTPFVPTKKTELMACSPSPPPPPPTHTQGQPMPTKCTSSPPGGEPSTKPGIHTHSPAGQGQGCVKREEVCCCCGILGERGQDAGRASAQGNRPGPHQQGGASPYPGWEARSVCPWRPNRGRESLARANQTVFPPPPFHGEYCWSLRGYILCVCVGGGRGGT